MSLIKYILSMVLLMAAAQANAYIICPMALNYSRVGIESQAIDLPKIWKFVDYAQDYTPNGKYVFTGADTNGADSNAPKELHYAECHYSLNKNGAIDSTISIAYYEPNIKPVVNTSSLWNKVHGNFYECRSASPYQCYLDI